MNDLRWFTSGDEERITDGLVLVVAETGSAPFTTEVILMSDHGVRFWVMPSELHPVEG